MPLVHILLRYAKSLLVILIIQTLFHIFYIQPTNVVFSFSEIQKPEVALLLRTINNKATVVLMVFQKKIAIGGRYLVSFIDLTIQPISYKGNLPRRLKDCLGCPRL